MKKTLLLALLFVIGTAAYSQDHMDKKMDHSKMKMHGKMRDCVMMEDGKMMVMKGGSSMAMDQDMTLSNGTMVMTDGTVKWKNGKTMKLKDDQCVYMDGRMGSMKMKSHKMKM